LFERQMAELGPSRPGILMRVEELDLDPETGAYIRNVLRQFGYAVGICGINLGVAARNVDLLTGFDLVEITHTSEIGIEDAKRLANVIAKLGAKRAILTGMRTEAQLKAARQAGAQFVAGPIVDALA
jgi:c-di-GMP-related signal transduction protein